MIFVSLYENKEARNNRYLSIEDYISWVRSWTNQDLVLKARAEKEKGNKDGYDELKYRSMAITGCGTIVSGEKKESDKVSLNGLIVIDIDKDQVTDDLKIRLQNDPYTYIMHQSFGGGQNYCIFVKIDVTRFEDSFLNLAEYYLENYGVKIDPSCKNKNRLRFVSIDRDIFVNDKSKRWRASKPKEKAIKKESVNYVFFDDDFDNILAQIKEKGINICSDYNKWVNVGVSLATKFGISGIDKFNFISSFDSKYNQEVNESSYKGFVKSIEKGSKISIGTFYYYCKEAGIDIYTEKTKTILNSVKISKSKGNPTIESITQNLEIKGFEVNERDHENIQFLINSEEDFSNLASDGLTEIEIITNYLMDRFEPYYNNINKELYVNENELVDNDTFSDIWVSCLKDIKVKKHLTENNVDHVLKSKAVPRINIIEEFFNNNYTEDHPTGLIKAYADCIQPYNEFNEWALKHWLVGAVYNWLRDGSDREASPLVLGLTGGEQGIGKTTFIKNLLPDELYDYSIIEKINKNDKDSLYRMATSLIMIDEEFAGESTKNDEDFKSMCDTDKIQLRRAYGKKDVFVSRITALAFTSNKTDVIKDITGNRRTIPVYCEGFDFEAMKKINKVDLICEAYGLLKNGFDWRIYGEKKDYLNSQTQRHVEIVPFDELFFNYFSLTEKQGMYPVIINQGDILDFPFNIKVTKSDIKNLTVKYKMENKSRSIDGRTKTGYKVYVKSDNKFFGEWHNNTF